ncbi:uncharacterized methyltransferase At1g78140, chloroplastic isoform X2 [Asparagus officinalis]|uniref:uncharacterized methyltransferase At1g78140, chloroplastic isoform X2 n=1 Tax=Asparagus officinalis TaxID=4686 RepID=UPI00098E800E|nr:uncharacterized methyltransferase At1g78140, chloroplastic isoform X2 [Asparagus officinalis]
MVTIIGGCKSLLIPRGRFIGHRNPMFKPRRLAAVRAAASATEIEPDLTVDAKVSTSMNLFACPICYYPLINRSQQSITTTSGSLVECSTCKKSYLDNDIYLDLTLSGGSKEYDETMPAATELFRTPLVSFLYERGWRQNFVWGGFPGPEREFEMAKGYLEAATGGMIIDASCGSGLFSRLFAKSGLYSLVVALDFSENMLRQCDEFIKQENISKDSVDAVHAGAALHCWPSPSAAVAEISRVLRPGGVFVATTFILDVFHPAVPVFRAVRQIFTRASSNNLFLSEGELKDLCRASGLVDFTCTRNGPFVMLSATKPGRL